MGRTCVPFSVVCFANNPTVFRNFYEFRGYFRKLHKEQPEFRLFFLLIKVFWRFLFPGLLSLVHKGIRPSHQCFQRVPRLNDRPAD